MSHWRNRSIRARELIERLRDRLNPEDYRWAAENADNAEWEIAVHVIREAQERGELVLAPNEVRELASIER